MTSKNRLTRFSRNLLVSAGLALLLAFAFALYITAEQRVHRANEVRHQSFLLADELRQSGDELTRMVRTYVATGDPFYKQRFQDILDIRNGKKPRPENYWRPYWDLMLSGGPAPRPNSAQTIPLVELMRQAEFTESEFRELAKAKTNSDALTAPEFEAMKLVEAGGPNNAANRAKALGMLYDPKYHRAKVSVMKPIHDFLALLDQRTLASVQAAEAYAAVLRNMFVVIGLGLMFMLWRTYTALSETLGGSLDEVQTQIARIGGGDLSSAIAQKEGRENSVLGWLSATQARLNDNAREHKRDEEVLRESEERFRATFEQAAVGLALVALDGHWLRVNEKVCAIVGYSREELLPLTFQDITHPDDLQSDLAQVHRLLAGEIETYSMEKRYFRKDGAIVWINLTASLVRQPSGEPKCFIAVIEDIAARKEAKEALRESQRFLRATVDALSAHIAVLDEDGAIIAVNMAWHQFAESNHALGARVGLHINYLEVCESTTSPDRDEALKAAEGIRAVLCGDDEEFTLEYPCHSPTEQRWFVLRATRFPGEGPRRAVVAHENITARKEVEETLRASEERFRAFMDNTPAFVFIKDEAGRYVYLNKAIKRLVEMPVSELRGKTNGDRLAEETARQLLQNDLQVLNSGQSQQFEEIVPAPDGSLLHELVVKFPLTGANGERLLAGVAVDITERKQIEEALQERARLAALGADVGNALTRLEALPESLHLCAEALVHHLDIAIAHIWTLNEAENVLELQASVGRDSSLGGLQSRIKKGQFRVGTIAETCTALLSNDMNADRQFGDGDWATAQGMVAFAGYPLLVDDRLVGVISLFSTRPFSELTFNTLGTVAHEIALGIKRKRTEDALQIMNDQLELRVKERTAQLVQAKEEADSANRAKSEFLSRMSHELRTPLNSILGFGQILELAPLEEQDSEAIRHILKSRRHLLNLINEVLDIARIEAGGLSLSPEPIPVAMTIREVLDIVRPLAAERRIQIVNECNETDRHALADQQRFQQVLLNLLSNAIKYNRDAGRVTISCEAVDDGHLRLNIRDTGAGLTLAEIGKLFVPFERLGAANSRVEGTGIGLALCKRLVEAMEGRIGVNSVPGEGSVFWVELPLTESQDAQFERMNDDGAAVDGPLATLAIATSRTVLYIEDNLLNLKVIERILRDKPEIKLLSAMQGSIGLDMARQHAPDMILLDLHLPDISGEVVLRRLRAEPRTRDIPVVVLSADAMPGQINKLHAAGVKHYLTKPLDLRQFMGVLEEALGGEDD